MNEAPLHQWLCGPLPRGVGDLLDRLRRTEGVAAIAVMPDVHLASEFCVGTVVASEQFLFPNAVGGDIGCGMLAMRFETGGHSVQEVLADAEKAARVLGALALRCPGRRHHRRTAHAMPCALAEMPMSHGQMMEQRAGEEVRLQLGTLGAGNHFLELQAELVAGESGGFWLMLHTGSRHLGQLVLHHHLPRTWRLATGIVALSADSKEGRDYLRDVAAARAWARENRRLLALAAADALHAVLGIEPDLGSLFDCDHNHVQLEVHAGRSLYVHRKGATPAGFGQGGLIPGSMGTRSFHTVGKGCAKSLDSSSHGAGRALSRTQAREKITRSALRQQLRSGGGHPLWYDVRLERSLIEEAPKAYKPIEEVMAAQSELTEVRRTLLPLLIHKGV